jgi:hypothetical protein
MSRTEQDVVRELLEAGSKAKDLTKKSMIEQICANLLPNERIEAALTYTNTGFFGTGFRYIPVLRRSVSLPYRVSVTVRASAVSSGTRLQIRKSIPPYSALS